MNVVKEINAINQRELESGGSGSWHDEYKDSAYVFVGGLPFGLTEGDLITIFSQFGEVIDVNMPRDKETGKTRGFGFVMYEDQRSTVLAVDNLNGGKVIDRTIRVDHVKNYKQPKVKGEDGEMAEREEQSLNAKPLLIRDDISDDGSVSSAPSIDPEDPMRDYLLARRKEEKSKSSSKSKKKDKSSAKRKRPDETPEERRLRKERKRAKKARGGGDIEMRDRSRSPRPRSRSPRRLSANASALRPRSISPDGTKSSNYRRPIDYDARRSSTKRNSREPSERDRYERDDYDHGSRYDLNTRR